MRNLSFTTRSLALACGLLLLWGSSLAQTVWRCGIRGNHYSDNPCAGGYLVPVADSQSEAELLSAQKQLQRAQALADRMRSQRLQEEHHNYAANAHPGSLTASRIATAQAAAAQPVSQKAMKTGAKTKTTKAKVRVNPSTTKEPLRRSSRPGSGAAAEGAGTFRSTAAAFPQTPG
jgi:hypothetical protein